MKICTKCSVSKGVDEFYKCKKNNDGLNYNCKPCASAQKKKRKAKQLAAKWALVVPDVNCAFHFCSNMIMMRGRGGSQKLTCSDCEKKYKHLATGGFTVGHWISTWVVGRRSDSKKKGVPFEITPRDIYDIFPEDATCPILGIPFVAGVGGSCNNSVSIDKIEPSLGYVVGNIQIISKLANVMKSNATPEQLLKFADWVNTNYKENVCQKTIQIMKK